MINKLFHKATIILNYIYVLHEDGEEITYNSLFNMLNNEKQNISYMTMINTIKEFEKQKIVKRELTKPRKIKLTSHGIELGKKVNEIIKEYKDWS